MQCEYGTAICTGNIIQVQVQIYLYVTLSYTKGHSMGFTCYSMGFLPNKIKVNAIMEETKEKKEFVENRLKKTQILQQK